MEEARTLGERFRTRFGANPRMHRASGRVNLIGDHTDYNDGYVLPVAIDMYCWVAIAPRTDRKIVFYSENFKSQHEVDLSKGAPSASGEWSDYPVGVAVMLEDAGCKLAGAEMLIHGEVPLGAGLSSSASVEVATARALLDISGCTKDPTEIAKLCQAAENQFVGARCGIMDQFVACHGDAGSAILLDCRSLEFKKLALPEHIRLVVIDSMVKHAVAAGEYNQRRTECEEAVKRLKTVLPQIRALRDVSLKQVAETRELLGETLFHRVRHVVTENMRVVEAGEALRRDEMALFGKLMAESHASLRDDFQVSCKELDLLVTLAARQKGVWGARMTGGGFGGCTVNLVDSRQVEEFRSGLSQAYEDATGIAPRTYVFGHATVEANNG